MPKRPLSVVVASWSGSSALARCLESLEPQGEGCEVVAACNHRGLETQQLQARYPEVRFVFSKRDASVSDLRTLGTLECQRDFVALTEDHARACPGWVDALCRSFAAGHKIVGGPIENGQTRRRVDWALYFCEYGTYMPPLEGGPVPALSGMNVAYDRLLLEEHNQVWANGLDEGEVNSALVAAGHTLHAARGAMVVSYLPFTLWEGTSHLFAGGRRFGGYRVAEQGAFRRALWFLASPAVPAVLLARLARGICKRNPSRLAPLLGAMPFIAVALGGWSLGEACGYLTGPAREATERELRS